MTTRRAIFISIAAAVVFVVVVFLGLPLSWVAFVAYEAMFPASISWDGKTAWARCDSAIAGKTSWPASPHGACRVMHMCANEAPLNEQQTKLLYQAIRNTPGCQEP